MNAKTIRIRFVLSEIFPPTNPFSISVIRLLMAVNDARHFQKLLVQANKDKIAEGSMEQSVKSGEILHLFRLLCAQLYEAGIAFRGIQQDAFDEAIAIEPEAKKDLTYLRESFSADKKDALHYGYMKPIRDNLGAHYKMGPVKEALEDHVAAKDLDGVLVMSEFLGLSRYTVADHLANTQLRKIMGVSLDEYQSTFTKRMGDVIKLAGALIHIVDLLLFHLVKARQGAIIDQEVGSLVVPPSLARAHRHRLRELKEQKGMR